MWRYILLRSAAWLAFQADFFKEATKLAELGLNGNPPAIEKNKLSKLLMDSRKQTQTLSDNNSISQSESILGFLSSVNLLTGNINISQWELVI